MPTEPLVILDGKNYMEHLESGLSGRMRFHHVVFERGRGATGFYSESDDGRKAAQEELMRIRRAGGDGKVTKLGVGESYETIDPETSYPVNKIHGVDDGYHYQQNMVI